MTTLTPLKLNEPTKNFMRKLIVDNYLSNSELIESLLCKGHVGLFNLSDEQLIEEELPRIGFDSVEAFEQHYADELGL